MATLLAQHAATDLVAFGAAGPRTAAELLRDAGAIAAALPEPARASNAARPVALLAIRTDPYAFMAALLGAWARGYDAAVPPVDVTREAFLQLAQQPEIAIVLHDTLSTAPLRVDRVLAQVDNSTTPLSRSQLEAEGSLRFVRMEAGRTFEVARYQRAALQTEAYALADIHRLPERASCVSTVSPETRFGLLFGCLWPLLTGGAFWRDDARKLTWTAALPDTPGHDVVLVAAPAHLRSWLRATQRRLVHVACVISGTTRLPEQASAELHRHAGLRAVDVCAGDKPWSAPELAISHELAALEERIAWLPGVREAALHRTLAGQNHLAVLAPALDETEVRALLQLHLPGLVLAGLLVFDSEPWPLTAAVASFCGARRGFRRNPAGSHDPASLRRLFGLSAEDQPLASEVDPGAAAADGGSNVFSVHVPKDFGYFVGHFPGYPILPGAAQLSELVLPCVRRARPALGRLLRMARLKFQERILPDDTVSVVLGFAADETQVDFSLRRAGVTCAAGRLYFAAPEPAS